MSNTDQSNTKPLPQVDYNDGRWHGWNGGKCPVHPQSVIDSIWAYKGASGNCGLSFIEGEEAGNVNFEGNEHGSLVAFRVIKPYVEPVGIWVNEYPGGIFCGHARKEKAIECAGDECIRTFKVIEVLE